MVCEALNVVGAGIAGGAGVVRGAEAEGVGLVFRWVEAKDGEGIVGGSGIFET
jgi:hypothetical protein